MTCDGNGDLSWGGLRIPAPGKRRWGGKFCRQAGLRAGFFIFSRVLLKGYRRALKFLVPYWLRLILILGAGIAATGFGLVQPYVSKLLIDDALLKHNFHMLLVVSALMVGVTVLGFALNIFSSYQYV